MLRAKFYFARDVNTQRQYQIFCLEGRLQTKEKKIQEKDLKLFIKTTSNMKKKSIPALCPIQNDFLSSSMKA